MSYDNIYSQPTSLAAIAGSYSGTGDATVTISGSSLTMTDLSGEVCTISGTVTPHGSVGVFDVNFSFSTSPPSSASNCPLGSLISGGFSTKPADTSLPFSGILFQTTSGGQNMIEIAATNNAPNNPYYFFFTGSK
jgi:hypothetical protein